MTRTKPIYSSSHSNLYDRDFVAWSDEQALLLEQERFSELDLIHLIEEVRDLGRRERDAIESQLERLLLHILKWQYQPSKRTSSWEISIKDARKQIRRLIEKYPVLAKHLENENTNYLCYKHAIEDATDETGLSENTFPLECPYSLEQVLNSSFFLEATAEIE
ncbi:DUF29 domain-containing protein [Gloeocapsopsis dulcis]|uniref:DUF29 domain-containing protein n=1 Tax=Gloeocapsopsis dulcis AAB1 = 1H9 TaxID=1433147 RepID=A0A6N8FW36_9CHRO|nr:DUF29 domain-containing protein [Gloeocapsopsis dulcis]MUL37161.1 hypothetical protein [Gloeocapsopsis dulcis AAB1 = 1H9]WNN90233.1 DUF29 domain-containing protein [Gloeocapsopsis dulcis]